MNDISIVLCGEAGQGIQTVEQLFSKIVKKSGFFVYSFKEYMSRVRGGSNSTQIRIASESVASFVDRIDILVSLSKQAVSHVETRVTKTSVVLGEKEHIHTAKTANLFDVSFHKIAKDIGNTVYANTIAVGVLSSLVHIDRKIVQEVVRSYFEEKDQETIDNNIAAAEKGYSIGLYLSKRYKITFNLKKTINTSQYLLLNGSTSIGLGAIAGGCNFIASYPMSPATGVLTFLSTHANQFNMIAEQAEGEIAAINMALGAWYAGARGMVTTSGGGFALMTEGVSLAGMIESPLVLHVAQRPGPATGLPTRTEQGDLLHVLYAGHGEFPKIIYAPGTLEEGFYLTRKAFDVADRYQIPVIILTDQYFIDSRYMIPKFEINTMRINHHFKKTKEGYRRYQETANGISPRGIPGFGKGFICVDSDEHDEKGQITEDMQTRKKMVDKRMKKMGEIQKDSITPTLVGPSDYTILILGWGSTFYPLNEAVQRLKRDDVSFLHLSQVYPLHDSLSQFLKKAEKTIMVENNKTAQCARLIKTETGFDIDIAITQYTGLPFSVETIQSEIQKVLGR